MNTDIRHALVDVKEEINVKRDQEIVEAKQNYLEAVSNERRVMKEAITHIKAKYRQEYAAKKAELIAESEV